MERPIVAVLRQVIVDRADAGTGVALGTEPLAASSYDGLGTALLPVFALAAALTAAVCVGSLVVEWLRKPEAGATLAVTDPESAGLLSVGFVSGTASARWLPATVMLLAASGVIAIQDGAPFVTASRVAHRTCTSCSTATIRWPWGGMTIRATPKATRCWRCCRLASPAVRSRSGEAWASPWIVS